MSADTYHSDVTILSSSMLKKIYEDPASFEREYLLGKKSDSSAAHFVEGTYTHGLILEPQKVEEQFAIFEGFRKAGAAYESFSAANVNKLVISAPQHHRCLMLLKAYNARPEAVSMIMGGEAELTLRSSIMGVPVKCRADYINVDAGYIADVKTTSELSDPDMFRQTIAKYKYDLSASLYCQIANDVYWAQTKKLFDFYWIVISKQDNQCHIYKASSALLSEGTSKYTEALVKYKKCSASGIWTNTQATTDFSTKEYEIITL